MKFDRRTAAWAGLALIVVTNAVALGGAAFNRSGEPESTLHLTERELVVPFTPRTRPSENSGVSLAIQWRTLQHTGGASADVIRGYAGGNAPEWLDNRKMKSLGFDARDIAAGDPGFGRRLSRDMLVVLEMDGPAWHAALRRAQDALKDVEGQKTNDTPANRRGVLANAEELSRGLDEERVSESRLFAVDAGLDAAALRASYPDRSMYAIVRGRIEPRGQMSGFENGGAIAALDVDSVNVPLAWRGVFETPTGPGSPDGESRPHFEATVAVGRRLEPWLQAAAARAWPAPPDLHATP